MSNAIGVGEEVINFSHTPDGITPRVTKPWTNILTLKTVKRLLAAGEEDLKIMGINWHAATSGWKKWRIVLEAKVHCRT
jgi:hypothetical protein